MTIMRLEKIKCPDCGTISEVKVWDTINAQVSPKVKEALLHGGINKFTCAGCGKTNHILKSLLYHDMQNRVLAYFFPFVEVEKKDFYNQFFPDGRINFGKGYQEGELEDYQRNVHVVFSMDEMVHYILFREILAKYKRNISDYNKDKR